ncbi:ribbon-helix-helix, copG family protein [Burkholderia pseudomallei MSHR1079]|nr:ribbon-helix-helix, copG family protein [Burkholderia pseudomallei MSHR1079]
MHERKTQAINLRMSPKTKELLRRAAGAERRTLSNMLEVLILEYCDRHGISVHKIVETSADTVAADKTR